MAEKPKPPFDSDATVSQPAPPDDLGATIAGPAQGPDPDATIVRPNPEPDAEATFHGVPFDPEATVAPAAQQAALDPEATFRIPRVGRKAKKNPFAPQARPETLQVTLSSLGGVNPLVGMANAILAAVPQIRQTLRLKNPSHLRGMLLGQLEAFNDAALGGDVPERVSDAAAYALCALLDDAAAATPWGRDWIENGMLQAARGESDGGEGFFARLEEICADPAGNADLVEFYYVCLALGFEGRHRGSEGGRQALLQARDRLYQLIQARRPRPLDGLSERWRTPRAQAQVDAALQTAALVEAKVHAPAPEPAPEDALPPRWSLARLPRRAIPAVVAGVAAVIFVGYLAVLRLTEDNGATEPAKTAARSAAATTAPSGSAAPAVPASPSMPAAPAAAAVQDPLAALPQRSFAVERAGGRVALRLRSSNQFAPGSAELNPGLKPLVAQLARALERVPGGILVTAYTDATPVHEKFASNQALSEARAQSVARLLAAALADPKRVRAEGRGDAEPLAAGASAAARARNRRFEITLQAPK